MSTVSAAGTLSAAQVADYDRDGFLIVRNVFHADEVALLAAEAEELMLRTELMETLNLRCRWQNHVDTGECTFDCFDPVIDLAPVCRFVAYDDRILGALRSIYRDEAHLFKDKLIFKRPGMTGYAMHQDFISWNDFPESFVTVVVAIDPTGVENGGTEVFSGYHQLGCMTPRDGDYHTLPEDAVDLSRGTVLELAPGDMALFSGFTPHRSAPNRTDRWRRQLYLSYNAGRDGGDRRDDHYREFHEWLVGKYAQYGKAGTFFR